MGKTPRKRRLSAEARRALALLAGSPDGVNEDMLVFGHGFSRQMLAGLVRAGLATVRQRVVMAGTTPVEVSKVMITAAGREALGEK